MILLFYVERACDSRAMCANRIGRIFDARRFDADAVNFVKPSKYAKRSERRLAISHRFSTARGTSYLTRAHHEDINTEQSDIAMKVLDFSNVELKILSSAV